MEKKQLNTKLDELNSESRGENLQGDRCLSGKGNTDKLNSRSENQSNESGMHIFILYCI